MFGEFSGHSKKTVSTKNMEIISTLDGEKTKGRQIIWVTEPFQKGSAKKVGYFSVHFLPSILH